jgi:hypothetical protein
MLGGLFEHGTPHEINNIKFHEKIRYLIHKAKLQLTTPISGCENIERKTAAGVWRRPQ